MKKRFKGLLGLWLALAMLVGMMAVPVYALEGEYESSTGYEFMVYTGEKPLKDGGLINGYYTSDSFKEFGIDDENDLCLLSDENNVIPNINTVLTYDQEKNYLDGWALWGIHRVLVGDDESGDYTYYLHNHNTTINAAEFDEMTQQKIIGYYQGKKCDCDPIVFVPVYKPIHQINPQPKTEDPTAGGEMWNGSEYADVNAKYQWYEYAEPNVFYVSDDDAGEDEIEADTKISGDFSLVDGDNTWTLGWSGAFSGDVQIDFPSKEGDIITVNFPGVKPLSDSATVLGHHYIEDSDSETSKEVIYFTEQEDNTSAYEYEVKSDGRYGFNFSRDTLDGDILNAENTSFTFSITITRRNYTILEGETEPTLTLSKDENGNQYICKVTFEDGTVLWSNVVTYQHPEGTTPPTPGTDPAPTPTFDNARWNASLRALLNRQFEITASASEGGAISPAGTSMVGFKQRITYKITADENYAIADVIVDGKSVGAVTEYTFNEVCKAHTIKAVFEEIEESAEQAE